MEGDAEYLDDNDINEDDMEIEKKKPNQSNKRKAEPASKGKQTKAKYVFNTRDRDSMKLAIKRYGASYATIAKEYFSDATPPVTRVDVQNYIQNNPHLKEFCKRGMMLITNKKKKISKIN